MEHKYISLEVPQNSTCNLDCVYCYIPKNKALKKINEKWSKSFKDNSYYELVSEYYDAKDLEAMSFWGGEPSLGFKNIKDLEILFKNFPNLSSLSTSTNLTAFSGWKYLLENIDDVIKKYSINKKVKMHLQVSIDGSEEVTDKNRGKGTFKKIKENLYKLIDLAKNIKNLDIIIFNKSTAMSDGFKYLIEDKSRIKDYIFFMRELDCEMKSHLGESNNVKINLIGLPTLALPGDYTKEDGEVFYKFNVFLDEIIREYNLEKVLMNEYYERWKSLYEYSSLVNKRNLNIMFCCSAGSMMQGIDPDGTIHGCHGSFWYNYKDYLESSSMLADWCSGERIVEYDSDKYWNMMRNYIAPFRDKYNELRLKSVTEGFVHNIDNNLNIKLGTIKTLAIAGQISEIYKDDSWAKLFAAFIALKSSCWMNNMIITGSPSVAPLSIYRIYGNGVFEHFVKKFWRKNNVKA